MKSFVEAAEPLVLPIAQDEPRSLAKWYVLSLLFFVNLLTAIDRAVLGVVGEPIKLQFQLTDSQMGLLSGFAYSVPFALASLPVGLLIDRKIRTRVLGIIGVIWSVATGLGAGATNFFTLALARMAVGGASAGAIPASLSILSDTFPPERRGTPIGIFYGAGNIAQLVVYVGGAFVLVHFGWRNVFLIAGAPGLILAALIWFTMKEPARGRFDAEQVTGDLVKKEKPSMLGTIRLVIFDPPVRNAMIGNMISTGITYATVFWSVAFFRRVHDVPVATASIYTGVVMGVVSAVAAFASGPIIDRVAKGDAAKIALFPACAAAVAAAASAVMVLSPAISGALIGFCLVGICSAMLNGPGNLVLVSVSTSHTRGSIIALGKLFSILVGSGVFAYLAGSVSDLIGGPHSIRYGLLFIQAFFLFAALHYYLCSRAITRIATAQANRTG